MRKNPFLFFLIVLFVGGCTTGSRTAVEDAPTNLNLKISSFQSLPGWGKDDFRDFAQAYKRSCDKILQRPSQNLFYTENEFGNNQQWQISCRKFEKINKTNKDFIRRFFEENFTPYQVSADTETQGLFTGYYEASLNGSKSRHGEYQVPLRARPDDLVMVDLGEFREELKGQRIAGRVKSGKLKPYETHAEIINGKLPPTQDKALVWVDSAVDAFFIQIQGSGIVAMDDGSIMRVGYAGQNGHPYYAIGRELIKRGELTKDNVSMQSIRDWLEKNPSQAHEIMTTNKSYVFFTDIDGEGPIGAQNVALTPMRSLAIDRSLVPYGMPVWLSVDHPAGEEKINRLMVTQDTGGAIRGPVRGDFFWGYGDQAERLAGDMKSKGSYWFLIPNPQ